MKHTIKGYITYEKKPLHTKPTISFMTFKPRADMWPHMVVVREHSIEVEVADNFDPRPEMIALLREQEKQARADFEVMVQGIRQRISELQAIEHTVSS